MGNGGAKELICMSHGHELRAELMEKMGELGRGG